MMRGVPRRLPRRRAIRRFDIAVEERTVRRRSGAHSYVRLLCEISSKFRSFVSCIVNEGLEFSRHVSYKRTVPVASFPNGI